MKTYRVYADDRMLYKEVDDNNSYGFWYMITDNCWLAEDITND